MGLKSGYKQTEVGVIPEDWGVKPLGAVVTFLDGKRRPVKDSDRAKMRGTFPYYGASGIVDYVNDFLFDDELILLGEDGENILSRNCRLAFRVSGKVWVNNHAHVLKPNADVSLGFLTDFLESLNYERFNSGTAQPKLNKQTCSSISIALPPTKGEQEAIAEALSDADTLIESLEQLLAKKRHLKQGAMQKLLTGKKRLPGFSDEWKAKRLREVCRLIVDGTHFTPHYVDSGVAFYSVENLTANDFVNTKFISRTAHIELSKRCRVERGDILLTRIGSIGDTKLIDWDVDASIYVSLALLKTNEDIDARYLHCYSKSRQFIRDLEDRSLMNASPKKINMGEIGEVPIIMPSLDEQVAIATILSDMDTEITTLKTKLTKARQLKTGMMQELLAGRIRLV